MSLYLEQTKKNVKTTDVKKCEIIAVQKKTIYFNSFYI